LDWFVDVVVDDLEGRESYISTTSIYMSVALALGSLEHAPQRHFVRWSDTVDALRCFM